MPQQSQTTPKDSSTEPEKVSFSIPQVIGGALAAATAAAVGSQIGMAGTIVGAAVASIVGGVAGTVYSAGIDRTHRKVAEALRRSTDAQADSDPDDTAVMPSQTEGDPGAETAVLEADTIVGSGQDEADAADETKVLGGDSGSEPSAEEATSESEPRIGEPEPQAVLDPVARRRRLFIRMGLTIAAIFVLAVLLVTVFELTLGRSLDGTSGTTVGQIAQPRAAATATATATTAESVQPSTTTVTVTQSATTDASAAPASATATVPATVVPDASAVPTQSAPLSAVPTVSTTS